MRLKMILGALLVFALTAGTAMAANIRISGWKSVVCRPWMSAPRVATSPG